MGDERVGPEPDWLSMKTGGGRGGARVTRGWVSGRARAVPSGPETMRVGGRGERGMAPGMI